MRQPALRPQAFPRRTPRLVPAVERTVLVLRALSADGIPLRLSDLSRQLDLSKSTLSELLVTLEHFGLVERDGDSRAYRPGYALLELGSTMLQRLDIRQIARPYLARLRDAIGETAVLHIPLGQGAMIIERTESDHQLKVVASIGHRLPAFAGAVAKVFLAARPDQDLPRMLKDRALPNFTPNSLTDPGRYREELERVRRRGYAIDDEEYLPGVRAASAPVRDVRGRTVATITVVGSSARLGREQMRKAASQVLDAAEQVSHRMGAPAYPWTRGRAVVASVGG